MKKSKQERAQEIKIEQQLIKMGKPAVMQELENYLLQNSPTLTKTEQLRSRVRLNLLLKWNRPVAK